MSTSTPWTRKGSSLPSDRIKPKPNQSPGKRKPQRQPTPKSKALQSLLHALQSTTTPTPDPKGGCFCQARVHPLSRYTSACPTCGLVLCSLNPPQHACPHCRAAPPHPELLIARVQAEIKREEEEHEREEEERIRAAGAFPTLPAAGGAPTPTPTPSQHKVLSVNSKTKKVTVKVASTSTGTSTSRAETPEPIRVPPPAPPEAPRKVDEARPFANYVVGHAAKYVPSPSETRTKKTKKKEETRPL
ncbi:uncharacterized protein BT62DRAFT_921894 [Guyanagaster necrorhizus]|uniref:TRIP4/RQT4 C2HC5-type zinc finger domain-containing protein n=1 Tax=Guyanagaster necrorhizus TaxID=856835 RepID=A0A9P7VLJ0_9AGAR|nr:uncharacterized protein BT62DRAFT_921894 [Guyanagaster necrorhizus MCA 3950]KAG7443386.1 hypothetical protein BT62DRAFT_921894 [Guyanagaster necrorhizus MCA 3950]